MNIIKNLEGKGYDAAIIGCFYDPGLLAAREITNRIIITAPVEESLHVVASFKYAKYLVELRYRFGWQISKRYAFKSPPFSEISKWQLDQQYF